MKNRHLQKLYLRELAKNIKKARKQAGLTQTEMAKKLNKSKRYISKLERARYDLYLNKMLKIQECLNVELAVLVNFSKVRKIFKNFLTF